jgi:hypothetical protein
MYGIMPIKLSHWLWFFLGIALAGSAQAGSLRWTAGLRTQGYWDFEPGNDYMVGPEIGLSYPGLVGGKLQCKVSYLTSRLEQAFRENILRQDFYLLSPAWHFRPAKILDPLVQIDLGYTRYDVESDIFKDLENSGWIAALQIGANLNLAQGRWGAFYHFGYNFLTPTVVYPGVFGFGIWVKPWD